MPREETISIIPKAKPRPPFWLTAWLYVSIGLIVIICVFALIFYQQEGSLYKKIEALSQQSEELENSSLRPLEISLMTLSKKSQALINLFNKHQFASRVFSFTRSVCHKSVQFTDFNLDMNDLSASLTGQARDFLTLAEQAYYLSIQPALKSMELASMAWNEEEGKVIFEVSLVFSREFFRGQ